MSKLIESRQFNTYSRIHTHTYAHTKVLGLALCVAVVVVAACGTRFIVDKCAFIYRRHHSGSVAVHVCACKCECGLLSFVPSFIHFLFTEEHTTKRRGLKASSVRDCVCVCECVDNTSKVKFKLNLTNKSQKLYARCCTPYAALIAAGNGGGDALKN